MDQQSEQYCGTFILRPTMKIGGFSKFQWKLKDIRITKIILAPIWATIFIFVFIFMLFFL